MVTQNPHRDIGIWLDELDLRQYKDAFSKFIGVEEILYYCEADIKRLGVRNSAHRARIISSLVTLRENYSKEHVKTTNKNTAKQRSKCYSFSAGNDRIKEEESQIYEILTISNSDQKQSKSFSDLVVNMDNQSIDDSTLSLKKALEWELSLDSRDLRSHAWYHGPIPRQRADEIVLKEGDFLIRDCVSQPGNFVLTCKTKGPVLHFVINKILIQPETVYERVQYQFEDDAYDTVPDLITFYVGSGKAISAASGARIQYPCNRSYPLSFYATKYGNSQNVISGQNTPQQQQQYRSASPLNSPSLINIGFRYPQHGNYTNSYRSPLSSPPRTKGDVPPRLPSKKHRSQSLTPNQQSQIISRVGSEKYCSADGVIQGTATEITNPAQIRSTEKRRLLNTNEKCNSADGVIQNQSKSHNNFIMSHSSDEKSSSSDGIINLHKFYNDQQTNNKSMRTTGTIRTSSLTHDNSDLAALSPCIEQQRQIHDNTCENNESTEDINDNTNNSVTDAPIPPPKPQLFQSLQRHPDNANANGSAGNVNLPSPLIDNVGPINRITSYHASGSDSGNGSGDSVQSSAISDGTFNEMMPHRGGVIIKNPRFLSNSSSLVTLKNYGGNNSNVDGAGGGSGGSNIVNDFDIFAAEQTLLSMNSTVIEECTKFDLENFQTLLLPSIENKPLDNSALNTIRIMLSETGPRVIANHLTRIDIRLILGDLSNSLNQNINYLNCYTGLELIMLEHGEQLRKDLIERTECIRLLVAVTILTCSSDDERAETLNKWIQVAIDTKTALGNLFGFCAIMLGLCMPQIQKLEPTWHVLRQKYTDSAFNFEAKLRPTLKNMNDCSNPQAPNTTVPHLLPYILLRDRCIDDVLDSNSSSHSSTLISTCVTPWEVNSSDFGLTILFAHLDSLRNFTKNLPLYKRNAQIVLEDSSSRLDELLEDSFRTEFHLKFLWGSKGALAAAIDRHTKLEQVLTLMAEKFCYGESINSVAA